MESQQPQAHLPSALTPKKSPGRPPKLKPIPAQPTSQGQVGGAQPAKKRGRPPKQHQQQQLPGSEVKPEERKRSGRPPKQAVPFDQPASGPGSVVKRRVGRPLKGAVAGPGSTGRPRGRPKKSGVLGPISRPLGKRPRGRPRKLGGGGLVAAMGMVAGKRRGRPPKGSTPRKPRRLSGKPLGRPRKDASAARSLTFKRGIANEELMTKLELIQIKVRAAVGIIRPYIANENTALMALQQLEELVTTNITAPPAAPPQAPEPVSLADDPSLTAPPTDPATTTITGTAISAPAVMPMAAPGAGPFFGVPGLFSVNLPALDITAPLHMPPAMESQPPMSWVPSSGTQS